MSDFINMVKGIVGNMLANMGQPRHGIVASVDPTRAVVRVTLDEDGTLSGWLPIAQQAVGGGWGMVTLPKPGTQVFMVPDMGDQSHLVVVGAVHSTLQPPGKVTPYKSDQQIALVPGEPTMISESGASFRLTAGGVIEMRATTVKIDGDLLVSGQIRDLNGDHDTLQVLRADYNKHVHADPQGGNVSTTDSPTP